MSTGRFERIDDLLALKIFGCHLSRRHRWAFAAKLGRQIGDAKDRAFAHSEGVLGLDAKLAHISWPVVVQECIACVGTDADACLDCLAGDSIRR